MTETVEELESELQELYLNMDDLAEKVQLKELDAYEGFMQSEKYKNKIVEIGNALKERGIDITTRTE
ncbi:MAG: hypothetical protein J7K14_09280 [Sulfurimonas sp.]|nr:hypothetical protein [Sulfurimonas sp.]